MKNRLSLIWLFFICIISVAKASSYEDILGSTEKMSDEQIIEVLQAPQQCHAQIHQLSEKMIDYEDTVGNGKNLFVEKKYKAVKKILNSTDVECSSSLQQAYLLFSLKLLTGSPNLVNYGKNYLLRIGAAVLLGEKVIFLSDEMRRQWGGSWNSLGQKNRHLILGGYDCQETKIYLDPTLPPYDLASAYVHEMDHLFRDKMVNEDSLFTADPRAYLLMDETYAASHAAYLERDLQRSIGWMDRGRHLLYPWLYVPFVPVHPFHPDSDISFVSSGGHLEKIWKILEDYMSAYYPDLILQSLFQNEELSFLDAKGKTAVSKAANGIIAIMKKIYFPDTTFQLSADNISQLRQSTDLIPLSRALTRAAENKNASDKISAISREIVEKVLSASVSRSCQYFEGLSKDHQLEDYLGNMRDGESDTAPGGIRPGSEGVKTNPVPKGGFLKKGSVEFSTRALEKNLSPENLPNLKIPADLQNKVLKIRPCVDSYDRL